MNRCLVFSILIKFSNFTVTRKSHHIAHSLPRCIVPNFTHVHNSNVLGMFVEMVTHSFPNITLRNSILVDEYSRVLFGTTRNRFLCPLHNIFYSKKSSWIFLIFNATSSLEFIWQVSHGYSGRSWFSEFPEYVYTSIQTMLQ